MAKPIQGLPRTKANSKKLAFQGSGGISDAGNKIISSFVVNEFDFNLYLGLEANSSAGPQSKLAFQIVVLECKVLPISYCFNIIFIASRIFPTQTVVGLVSLTQDHPTPM